MKNEYRGTRIPQSWYNLRADLSEPLPPPLGADGHPLAAKEWEPLFTPSLVEQEYTCERSVPIPEEVLERLSAWRPTPLRRAKRFEEALGTKARIYYKDESVSPAGSHKATTAVAQAYYNKRAGVKRLVTETGAGQWGSALSLACGFFGLQCLVYMVRNSYEKKPLRRILMETWGGRCLPSPTDGTEAGRQALKRDPNTPGSLGIAIAEAVERVVSDGSGESRYALGSVLNHVLLHQSLIGLEAMEQIREGGESEPDTLIGCVGGGSNFAGLTFPFLNPGRGTERPRVLAVEPASCPTLTRGPFGYDHGDSAGLTPLLPMHSLGRLFIPNPIHAGGLRYHGMAPLVSHVLRQGMGEAWAVPQSESFKAALLFARSEGIVPAPETGHALAGVVREALSTEGKGRVILFTLSGHGLLDLQGYADYMGGRLEDVPIKEEELLKSVQGVSTFEDALGRAAKAVQPYLPLLP